VSGLNILPDSLGHFGDGFSRQCTLVVDNQIAMSWWRP